MSVIEGRYVVSLDLIHSTLYRDVGDELASQGYVHILLTCGRPHVKETIYICNAFAKKHNYHYL